MKKKIWALSVMIICLAIAALGTSAYYTSDEIAHNTFTTGNVEIEIIEKTKDKNGAEIDFPKDGIFHILPGVTVAKKVTIKNTGPSSAWVRAEISTEVTDEAGISMPITFGSDNALVVDYKIQNGWILGEDGYYYCKSALNPGGTTSALLKEVTFNPALGNEYQNCIAKITVSAQAVQKANNGKTVTEAKGWP